MPDVWGLPGGTGEAAEVWGGGLGEVAGGVGGHQRGGGGGGEGRRGRAQPGVVHGATQQGLEGSCLSVRRLGLPVGSPDLRQLRLFPDLLRVVGAVLHRVGLVAGVVADGTDVHVQGGAHHSPGRVLQHVGGVHGLGLIVVLKYQDRLHTLNNQTLLTLQKTQ